MFLIFIFALDIWSVTDHTKKTEQFKGDCVEVIFIHRSALIEIHCLYKDNVIVAVQLNYTDFILL